MGLHGLTEKRNPAGSQANADRPVPDRLKVDAGPAVRQAAVLAACVVAVR